MKNLSFILLISSFLSCSAAAEQCYKIVDYKVAYDDGLRELEKSAAALVKEGYEPVGGIATSQYRSDKQAFIKKVRVKCSEMP